MTGFGGESSSSHVKIVPSCTKREVSKRAPQAPLNAATLPRERMPANGVHTAAFRVGLQQSDGFVVNYLTVGRESRGFVQSGMTFRKAQIDGLGIYSKERRVAL